MRKSRIRQNQPRTPHPNRFLFACRIVNGTSVGWQNIEFNSIYLVRCSIRFQSLCEFSSIFLTFRWWNCSLLINMANATHNTHYNDRSRDITLTIEFISMQNRKRTRKRWWEKEQKRRRKYANNRQQLRMRSNCDIFPLIVSEKMNDSRSVRVCLCSVVIVRNATQSETEWCLGRTELPDSNLP